MKLICFSKPLVFICLLLLTLSCNRFGAQNKYYTYSSQRYLGGYSNNSQFPNNHSPLSGMLTAGEINDFSKWQLWTDVSEKDLSAYRSTWTINPLQRYCLQVQNTEGRPIPNCRVELLEDEKVIWAALTDNTGKAELWRQLFSPSNRQGKITARVYAGTEEYTLEPKPFFENNGGVNFVKVEQRCNYSNGLDILFTVDATGSMGDEINYLKDELKSIIGNIAQQNPSLDIKTGALFYRCEGNSYVTKHSDFTSDLNITSQFINQQEAGEGGQEAVETAMDVSVNKLSWRAGARTRIMFMVLDEPPGSSPEINKKLAEATKAAAAKGIRIVPLVASGVSYGIDKSLEYLMRSVALATNGTYVFLTDHSGIGNSHTAPSTDEYDVELLNDVIVRIIQQFTYVPGCNSQPVAAADTGYVLNQRHIIAHEVIDTTSNNSALTASADTLVDFTQNTENEIITTELPKPDSVVQAFVSMKYYPNPTSGIVEVQVEGRNTEIYVSDIGGKLLFTKQLDNGRATIDLSDYPAGTYMVRCLLGKKWFSGKIIVLR